MAGKLRSPLASLGLWTVVCAISAAPSFYFGYGTVAREHIAAMCTGIALFIALYTFADQHSLRHSWRQSRNVALTLRIGYITRVLISIVFPIGASIDVICGLMSIGIVETVFPFLFDQPSERVSIARSAGFAGTLLVTLVQGVVLNVVLFGYMVVVLGIATLARPQSTPAE